MANAVMMSIEQATVGFNRDGKYIKSIDMRVGDLLGQNGVQDAVNLTYLNKGVNDDIEPIGFVMGYYDSTAAEMKVYHDICASMGGQ